MGKTVLFHLLGKGAKTRYWVTAQIFDDSGQLIRKFEGELPPGTKVRKDFELFESHYLAGVAPTRASTRIDAETIPDSCVETIKTADKNLGSSLDRWLNCNGMSPVREGLLECLTDKSEPIRFLVETKNSDLERLPWHKWNFFSEYSQVGAGLAVGVRKEPVSTPRDKVKVLVVFGNRKGLGDAAIDTEPDRKALKTNLEEKSNGELICLDEPTVEELCDRLETECPQILVFAGHSSSEEDKANGSIQLSEREAVNIDDLEQDLGDAVRKGLQLVIVNSCDGLGIGRQLGNLGVPNIIAMTSLVPDKVAQKFLQRLLKEFACGKPLFLAMREARKNLNRLQSEYPGARNLPVLWEEPTRKPLTWRSLGGIQVSPAPQTEPQDYRTESEEMPENRGQKEKSKKSNPLNKYKLIAQIILCAASMTLVGITQHTLVVVPTQQKLKKVEETLAVLKSNIDSKFFCDSSGSFPITKVRGSAEVSAPVIRWMTDSVDNPEETCMKVSAKFNRLYKSGNLNYLATGNLNGQSVICSTREKGKECTESGVLFKIPNGKNPEEVLLQLLDIRQGVAKYPLSL